MGASAVVPVLLEAGFKKVEIFPPHAAPDGDFPNVPNHVANPENPAVFDAMIEYARHSGAELILATDPDCDRLGCAVRKSLEPNAEWVTLTGNQLGALLADFLLDARRTAGTLTPDHYVVKTLVTTELTRRVAEHYGVQTAGNLHVGFKWIGAEMDARGPERFVFGTEESYGFLAGDHVRDKDGAVASLLTAELAARLKAEGKTLYERLDELFGQYGCFTEGQINLKMPGEKGMEDMLALMSRLRHPPPLLPRRHGRGRGPRLPETRTEGRRGLLRPRGERELRRGASLGHGAESQDLSLRLRSPLGRRSRIDQGRSGRPDQGHRRRPAGNGGGVEACRVGQAQRGPTSNGEKPGGTALCLSHPTIRKRNLFSRFIGLPNTRWI